MKIINIIKILNLLLSSNFFSSKKRSKFFMTKFSFKPPTSSFKRGIIEEMLRNSRNEHKIDKISKIEINNFSFFQEFSKFCQDDFLFQSF